MLDIAAHLERSPRGELEITDVNTAYLSRDRLKMLVRSRGMAWLDTGTHDSPLLASSFVETIEKRQGLKVSCPEEIAFRMGFIDAEQVQRFAQPLRKSTYGAYLLDLINHP